MGDAWGWLWGGYRLASNTHWGGFDVALMWPWGGFGECRKKNAECRWSSFCLLHSRGGLVLVWRGSGGGLTWIA